MPSFEDLLKEHTSYTPSSPAPWIAKTVRKEWKLASESNVKKLYWDRMYISEFPKTLIKKNDTFSQGLKILTLSMNQLCDLPASFGNLVSLEELDLSSNKFEIFPSVVLKLTNLGKLNFERNQLTTLPSDLNQLQNLQTLSFFGNQLKQIEDDTFTGMSQLQEIDLECNHIKTIPLSLVNLQSTTEDFILKHDDLSTIQEIEEPKRKTTGKRRKPPTKKKNPPAKRAKRN